MTALADLNGSRLNIENCINEIPFNSKLEYAQAVGVNDVEGFLDVLSAIDWMYVHKTNLKIKKMVEQNGRH